jgi:hypothetical protein
LSREQLQANLVDRRRQCTLAAHPTAKLTQFGNF